MVKEIKESPIEIKDEKEAHDPMAAF